MKYGIVLFILSIVLSVVLLSPSVKTHTMAWLLNTHKEILSQLEMEADGRVYKIVKIQNLEGLAVELYRFKDGEMVFLDSKQLTDKKDAFYKFNEEKHNLFLKDVNEDGTPEIILPSLDKNMRARLNIFTLDLTNEVLRKVSEH